MSVVDSPLEIPTKKEDRRWILSQGAKILAAIVIAGGTVALVTTSLTSNSQQATIERNNKAALCRSQIANSTDGVINLALVKLLEDPSTDGQLAILDLIISSQNKTPPDYESISQIAEGMRTAQADRKAYTAQVIEAIKKREQAIELCQPEPKEIP